MRKSIAIAGVVLAALGLGALSAGDVLSAPAKAVIGAPPLELGAEIVSIADARGRTIVGWLLRGIPKPGSVLLLHGVRSDRRQITDRATYLHRFGFSVLLVDLQAHGESDGDRVTFGYRESDGVRAGIDFLRTHNGSDRIGVIAVSLGAASFVLSEAKPPPDAVVLESMYPTIEDAISNRLRLRLGSVGPLFTPVFTSQMRWRLGIDATQLRPIDHVGSIAAPVLVVSGYMDGHTTADETRRIFESAREPKQLWLVDGAAHVDLRDYAPRAYERRISGFLERYLGERE